jgi:hypothetical protein
MIFRAARSGLANRLRALAGYQAMGKVLGIPFSLCWIRDPWCDASFTELFDAPIHLIQPDELEQLSPEAQAGVVTQAFWFDKIWETYLRKAVTWQDYLSEVSAFLDQLNPVQSISDTVDSFISGHDLAGALGIHVRHTDNIPAYRYWTKKLDDFDPASISITETFLSVISDYNADTPIFLATDDSDLEALCLKRFGGRILVFPKTYLSGAIRTSRITDALSEMLILGRCRRIVGTYYSSFSKFSAIWGGADYMEVRGRQCARNAFVDRVLSELEAFRR